MRVLKRLQLLICILHIDSKVKSYIRTKIIVWQVGSETTKVDSFDDYIMDGYQTAHQAWTMLKKKILTDFGHLQLSMEIGLYILYFWLPSLSIFRGAYE